MTVLDLPIGLALDTNMPGESTVEIMKLQLHSSVNKNFRTLIGQGKKLDDDDQGQLFGIR